MSKIKKILIILSILLILMIICVLFMLKKNDDKQEIGTEIPEYELTKHFTQLNNSSEYYNVKYCIDLYYTNLSELNKKDLYIDYYGYSEESFKQQISETLERVYCMLGKEYTEMFNITKDNILKHYSEYEDSKFYINNIYTSEISKNVSSFIVYGKQINYENNEISDYGFLIKLDRTNLTFEIYPYDYIKNKNYLNIEENKSINFGEQESIASNGYNSYIYQVADEETIAKDLFENYKNNLIYDIERAYELLDGEYRDKKFGNIDNFKNYIKNNRNKITKMYITNYKNQSYNDYNQYMCLDNNKDYYIFDITSMTNYKVLLDVYTKDLPEFIEKYNSSNDQEKVLLNIEKIKQAINAKDYKYVYSKLAQSFRDNKYKTEEELKNYLNNNVYDYIEIQYNNFHNEGETYIYDVVIKNLMNESDKGINMQIIMQLKDNRDFVMSFSIK